jgi:3-oxoacyl-[acyl-carrier protein] reductase
MLSNKIILITGSSSGIGRQISIDCSRHGAVILLAGRSSTRLEETAREIEKTSGERPPIFCYDIKSKESIRATFQGIAAKYGRLSGLVNCAGFMTGSALGMISEELILETISTNFVSALHHMQYAVRLIEKSGGGSIVNIGSIMGTVGAPYQTLYSGTKGALLSASLSAGKELAQKKIRVNVVSPGFVETPLIASLSEQNRIDTLSRIPLGRIGLPEDVAPIVTFLLSDRSKYITGQNIGVDGGLLI